MKIALRKSFQLYLFSWLSKKAQHPNPRPQFWRNSNESGRNHNPVWNGVIMGSIYPLKSFWSSLVHHYKEWKQSKKYCGFYVPEKMLHVHHLCSTLSQKAIQLPELSTLWGNFSKFMWGLSVNFFNFRQEIVWWKGSCIFYCKLIWITRMHKALCHAYFVISCNCLGNTKEQSLLVLPFLSKKQRQTITQTLIPSSNAGVQ